MKLKSNETLGLAKDMGKLYRGNITLILVCLVLARGNANNFARKKKGPHAQQNFNEKRENDNG